MARAHHRRRAYWILGVTALVALVTIGGPNIWVSVASAGRIHELGASDDTATAPVAIVLGASVYASGEPSPWLRYRLDTAAQLYESGRVDAILVSGDNGQTTYNEPDAMRTYLVSIGVPEQAIAMDYAGFDTYDTCVRAKEIFGVDQALVVTQDFHEPRAVSLCRAAGVATQGVADTRADADRGTWWRSWARERVAVVKAAWDVLTQRQPVLGDAETTVDDAIAWTRSQRG